MKRYLLDWFKDRIAEEEGYEDWEDLLAGANSSSVARFTERATNNYNKYLRGLSEKERVALIENFEEKGSTISAGYALFNPSLTYETTSGYPVETSGCMDGLIRGWVRLPAPVNNMTGSVPYYWIPMVWEEKTRKLADYSGLLVPENAEVYDYPSTNFTLRVKKKTMQVSHDIYVSASGVCSDSRPRGRGAIFAAITVQLEVEEGDNRVFTLQPVK